jgi:C4-dicarboxylate-specific signal transduction histidine kinase
MYDDSLEALFINLISNAIEAIEGNRLPPLVKVRGAVTKQNEMLVQVIDNGPGVRDKEKIFDAFVTTKAKGMGSVWPCHARSSRRMAGGFGLRMTQTAARGSV